MMNTYALDLLRELNQQHIDNFIDVILVVDGQWRPELENLLTSRFKEDQLREAVKAFDFSEETVQQLVLNSAIAVDLLEEKYLTPEIIELHNTTWAKLIAENSQTLVKLSDKAIDLIPEKRQTSAINRLHKLKWKL